MADQFEKPLKTMKITLLLSGIKVYHVKWHPLIETIINSIVYYFNLLILYTVIITEIYWLIDGVQIGRSFVEMSLTAPCVTMSILSTLKVMPLYFKRDIVCQIIDTLKAIHPTDINNVNENVTDEYEELNAGRIKKENVDFENDKIEIAASEFENTEKEVKLANEAVKTLKTVDSLLTVISILVLGTFLLAPLGSMYWGYFNTGTWVIKYPFSVKYWFDAYDTEFWPFVYIHQVWATIIVCVNVFGTETLFCAMCIYIEMHFRILCQRFENLKPGSSRLQDELVAHVRKHQLLIHLVSLTEALFSRPILFHIVSSSILICLSAFNITVAEEMGSMFAFVSFLLLSLSQVSLLCFFADNLMRSSTEVCGAIYKCPWYQFDRNTKKAVLIIIMRAQKPCKLTAANFADLNLRAFTTILSRSWSYFALLKTVYN